MEKKYIVTNELLFVMNGDDYVTLTRIKAIRDFGDVKKGDLGGFIEKEKNLSHEGNCWVYNDAKVYDDARVCDNAQIRHDAMVAQHARVLGSARVFNNAKVFGFAVIDDNAWVTDYAQVYEYACVSVCAKLSGNAVAFGHARLDSDIHLSGNDRVNCGTGDTNVFNIPNRVVMGPIGSRDGYTTFYKSLDNKIRVSCGCFNGTIKKFKRRVQSVYGEDGTSPNKVYYEQYINAIKFAKKMLLMNVKEG